MSHKDKPETRILIAGVDEAGRGPLAGRVVAAAVILDAPIAGLQDSKTLSEKKRLALSAVIKEKSLAWSVAHASVLEIDTLNILQASLLAMKRAVEALAIQPDQVLVDGNQLPKWSYPSQAIIKGDQCVAAISAASILAKTARDQQMYLLHEQYPDYGFNQHKGYPTKAHLSCLKALGPTPFHRKSFKPVKALLPQGVSK